MSRGATCFYLHDLSGVHDSYCGTETTSVGTAIVDVSTQSRCQFSFDYTFEESSKYKAESETAFNPETNQGSGPAANPAYTTYATTLC